MQNNSLIWIDLETTGLDHTKESILEIAIIITDKDLNIIDNGIDLIIHQPDHILNTMQGWPKKQHKKSGLTEASRSSTITLQQAEKEALKLVRKYCKRGKGILCGNSLFLDKSFLWRYMPALLDYLHYRIIDVSTIKELVRRWYGEKYIPKKKQTHRAREDILESIEELKQYRRTVFKESAGASS